MPAAVMISGTIMGEIRSAMMGVRHGMWERLSPSAARVPRVVASSVAMAPMKKLFLIESIHSVPRVPPRMRSYQRIE